MPSNNDTQPVLARPELGEKPTVVIGAGPAGLTAGYLLAKQGLPVIVLEAFAARVPVVATAVGGTPEVVEDGCNGYLVPAGDPPALAEKILQALRSESERKAMGLRGRQRIEEQFTFEAMCVHYEEVFERLTGQGKASAQPVCQG